MGISRTMADHLTNGGTVADGFKSFVSFKILNTRTGMNRHAMAKRAQGIGAADIDRSFYHVIEWANSADNIELLNFDADNADQFVAGTTVDIFKRAA